MKTDVLVLGAGPAGSATAYHLARQGIPVLLADRHAFPREKTCGGGIGPAGVNLLHEMGVLEPTQAEDGPYRSFRGVRIFAPNGSTVCLHYPWKQREAFVRTGYVMRRAELDEKVRARAVAVGARFLPRFRAIEPLYEYDRVVGFRGRHQNQALEIRAELTVLATGAYIGPVHALGLCPHPRPPIVAMCGYMRLCGDLFPEPYLEIHLDPELLPLYGWIFPVEKEVANVGVGLLAGQCKKGHPDLSAALERFVTTIPGARDRLAGGTWLESPRGFPIRTDLLTRHTCCAGALAVGEAAGLVDPLTGEGITLALQSGELAAQTAYQALYAEDVSAARLAAYERTLKRRYGPYFCYTQQMRTRLRDPRLANALVALARQLQAARASGWALAELAALLGTYARAGRVLGTTPYLSYRLLHSRLAAIET